jgi:hypothetical protein
VNIIISKFKNIKILFEILEHEREFIELNSIGIFSRIG